MNSLTLEPAINEVNHRVMFNNRIIGYFIMDLDGYYYFDYDADTNGLWTSHSLRMVADLLEEINKPHEDKINEYFKNTNI
jgi:hypothetical protein